MLKKDGDLMGTEGRTINNYQVAHYDNKDAKKVFKCFGDCLLEIKKKAIRRGGNKVRILDVGCGNGYFAAAMHDYFEGNAEVYGIDIVEYEAFENVKNKVQFRQTSAFDVEKSFESGFFDIVFCSAVIHHLICDTIKTTIKMQDNFIRSVNNILKKDGYLLVIEYTLESYIGRASTYIHSFLTSIRNPVIAKLIRKVGGKSAGVGTFFRSQAALKEYFNRGGFMIQKENPALGVYRFENGIKDRLGSIVLLCKEHRCNISFVLRKKGYMIEEDKRDL